MLAYLAAGAYLLARGYLEATWSGPEPSPIIVGLVAMLAYPALGFAAGALVPSRFVVPLVPIVLYVAQGLAIYQYDSPVSFLSPWAFLDSGQSVFWRVEVAWGLWLCVWLLALAVLTTDLRDT